MPMKKHKIHFQLYERPVLPISLFKQFSVPIPDRIDLLEVMRYGPCVLRNVNGEYFEFEFPSEAIFHAMVSDWIKAQQEKAG